MKKSDFKFAVRNALKMYYEHGYTMTAQRLEEKIFKNIDTSFNKKQKI